MTVPIVVHNDDSTQTTYYVGRRATKDTKKHFIVIPNDPTISRKHGLLRIHRTQGIVSADDKPVVFYSDLGSKCGSRFGNENLTPNVSVRLNNLTELHIGSNNTTLSSVNFNILQMSPACICPHVNKYC